MQLWNLKDITISAIMQSHQEPEVPEVRWQSAEDLNNSSKKNHILQVSACQYKKISHGHEY